MDTTEHGISIDQETVNQESIVILHVFGRLTHGDYEKFTPMLEAVLNDAAGSSVKMLVDISELQGWEIRAAWDDLKLGLMHGESFKKIALVGTTHWQDVAAKVSGWFLSGDLESFGNRDEALEWLIS